jgi:hypothetical protein
MRVKLLVTDRKPIDAADDVMFVNSCNGAMRAVLLNCGWMFKKFLKAGGFGIGLV